MEVHLEDLISQDLDRAVATATELLPDISAALDKVMPRIASDRAASRRYFTYVDEATKALAALPRLEPTQLRHADIVREILADAIPTLVWVAPTWTGRGLITALVDKLRSATTGQPPQCAYRTPAGLNALDIQRIRKVMLEVTLERELGEPLERAMRILDLNAAEVAWIMGVSRQAVDKWRYAGPPHERRAKVAAIAELADILHYRLRPGQPSVVARRQAKVYKNRTMLDLLAEDRHDWLLEHTKKTFDFTSSV